MIDRVELSHLVLIFTLFGSVAVIYAQQDQTSQRANTLQDDADDIQKQLDNEARDRVKYGEHKTIWVINFPTGYLESDGGMVTRSVKYEKLQERSQGNFVTKSFLSSEPPSNSPKKDWSYKDQTDWYKTYPDCGGKAQSPVDLPFKGLVKAKGARKLVFKNYDKAPNKITVDNDGRIVSLRGAWETNVRPFINGGAAHSRRYIFHSMSLHWPSEHSVGSLIYPMESQLLHIAAEYKTMEEAVNASTKDPLAFLGVANLYKFGNQTEKGLKQILAAAHCSKKAENCCQIPLKPLKFYNPPFKEYACYQGSLTTPPCKEAVLWFVRAKTLSVLRVCKKQLAHSLFMERLFCEGHRRKLAAQDRSSRSFLFDSMLSSGSQTADNDGYLG